jgi:hypothetical protein
MLYRANLVSRGLCILALGALVACQAPPSVETVPTPEAQSSDTAAPANALSAAPDEVPSIERQKEVALSLPPPVDDDPDRFMNATPAVLVAELGEPRLRRRESPAEVWQYRAQGCVLDFFLYQDAQTYKVVHLEARDLSARSVEARPCLRSLLETRQESQSG